MSAPNTARISPTAHYTGHVWERNGLCHPALAGLARPASFRLAQPLMWLGRQTTGGLDLEAVLLQRHRILDALLAAAIQEGRVHAVLEIAGGLSSRGLRFATQYPHIPYWEGDLPDMIARKQARLDAACLSLTHHRLLHINALAPEGPQSPAAAVAALAQTLPGGPHGRGIAILTEGLINYFPTPVIQTLWQRLALASAPFSRALYLSDIRLDEPHTRLGVVRAFLGGLSLVARGQVHLHFSSPADACRALHDAGFPSATLHAPSRWAETLDLPTGRRPLDLIHVLDAQRTNEIA